MKCRVRREYTSAQGAPGRLPSCDSACFQCKRVFFKEGKEARMFVTLSAYRTRTNEEDALIAIFENWQDDKQLRAKGYLSGELLRSVEDPRQFIAIRRFENREAAQALANDPEQDAWYRRIVSLTENAPVLNEYIREWPRY